MCKNYIHISNTKAKNWFANQGYALKSAYKCAFWDRDNDQWKTGFYSSPQKGDSLIYTCTPVWIVAIPVSRKKFHKLLVDNGLLMK